MVNPVKDEKNQKIPPLPKHWEIGKGEESTHALAKPKLLLLQLFCIVSFGRADLGKIWKKTHRHDSWQKLREDVQVRLANISLVVRLLLPSGDFIGLDS